MLRILLSGCNGRMGQALSRLCASDSESAVVAGIDQNAVKLMNYPVYSDFREYGGTADVVVDFSSPSSLPALLEYTLSHEIPLVLCTTGFSPEQELEIKSSSEKIPIFKSANMSLGISIITALCKKVAALLGETFDIEIVERHHNQKVDAPSGTALAIYNAIKDSLPFDATPVYDRHEKREKRSKNEIGLHAIRGGTIVGEHDIIFAGHDEVIEIRHSAASREVFAAGALKAARFLAKQRKPGLYDMSSVVSEI